jgi:hypothetical protein
MKKDQNMTEQELNSKARQRAIDERLHTFKITGEPIYLVRSRRTEPGSMRQVRVHDGQVTSCSCKGWEYRQDCTHAQAVTRRLEREGRRHRTPAKDQGTDRQRGLRPLPDPPRGREVTTSITQETAITDPTEVLCELVE